MDDESRARGVEIYKRLGLPRSGPALPDAFRDMTMGHLFGDVWSRPGLELRERSLATVTTLAALGRDAQLRIHLRGALNLGITRDTLEELFLHLAHYAGWPVAVSALQALAEVTAEDEQG
ncbi:MAG TPA: carboxymuconolactone decarboxylase family protein [Acidimicrobiales bacterium]|nr:carboxymuconolactone decarboxylase family protein [Acidimicrobiales bacterium]